MKGDSGLLGGRRPHVLSPKKALDYFRQERLSAFFEMLRDTTGLF